MKWTFSYTDERVTLDVFVLSIMYYQMILKIDIHRYTGNDASKKKQETRLFKVVFGDYYFFFIRYIYFFNGLLSMFVITVNVI